MVEVGCEFALRLLTHSSPSRQLFRPRLFEADLQLLWVEDWASCGQEGFVWFSWVFLFEEVEAVVTFLLEHRLASSRLYFQRVSLRRGSLEVRWYRLPVVGVREPRNEHWDETVLPSGRTTPEVVEDPGDAIRRALNTAVPLVFGTACSNPFQMSAAVDLFRSEFRCV